MHVFLPEVTAKLSSGVPAGAETTGNKPAIAARLGAAEALTIVGGQLWLTDAPFVTGKSRARADSFNANTGEWDEQLEPPAPVPPEAEIHTPHFGLAVSEATGRTYVSGSTGAGVVEIFESGHFQAGKTWAGAATPEKSFGAAGGGGAANIVGVAIDESKALGDWASGDVYVAASSSGLNTGAIEVFHQEPDGKEHFVTEVKEVSGKPIGTVTSIAVDETNGDLLVGTAKNEREDPSVLVFAPVPSVEKAYEPPFTISAPPGETFGPNRAKIAVDGSERDIYITANAGGEQVVDEYKLGAENKSATYEGRVAETETGPFKALLGLAVDPVTHRLFVADDILEAHPAHGTIDVFGPDVLAPDVVTLPERGTEIHEGNVDVTLNGTVNPLNQGPATCQFVWGTTAAFGGVQACEAGVAEGSSPVAVHATLKHLAMDTTYVYRLQARNKNGLNPGEPSGNQTFTTPGPGLHGQWASDVAATSATLDALVDPNGASTSAYLEYGETTSYGLDAPVPPGVTVGSGKGDVPIVPQHVQSLRPATTYHYRIVLSSVVEGAEVRVDGPDATFTTESASSPGLLDGRQWELVSPASKHGALIEPISQEGIIQASREGNTITYHTNLPTEAEPAGYANEVQVISARRSSGWSSVDIAVPHKPATGKSEGVGEDYRFFSEDLSHAVLWPVGGFVPLAPEASESTAYLRNNFNIEGGFCESECYTPLVTSGNTPAGTKFGEEGRCPLIQAGCGPNFEGGTPDASHLVLGSRVSLTEPASLKGVNELYEWEGGTLTRVSLLPGSHAPSSTSVQLGNDLRERNSISQNGFRVIWAEEFGGKHIYMHDAGNRDDLQLDTLQGGSGEGQGAPSFQDASADGSRVFFSDSDALVPGANNNGPDLYECAIRENGGEDVCELSDISLGSEEEPGELQGAMIGASSDGRIVYFVANGALAAGAVRGDCGKSAVPIAQQVCNLYVREEGVTRLVAVLSGEDEPDWGSENGVLQFMTAQVSQNGQRLVFMSDRSLSGYDNNDAVTGGPDEEIFMYEATAKSGSGELRCISCNPSGSRPDGVPFGTSGLSLVRSRGSWGASTRLAADLPGWTAYELSHSFYQSRYLSENGRVFFDTPDALSESDVNGTWDVYEYEPPGVGSCSEGSSTYSAKQGGCIGLISSGHSPNESAFLDASASGSDVFFLTTSKLARADSDVSDDVYDAHECTSSTPCLPEPAESPPACDTSDSCKAPQSAPSEVFGPPASETFDGAGNLSPQPVAPKPKLTTAQLRAQKLRAALKACQRQDKNRKKKRVLCEQQARKRFGAHSKSARQVSSPGRNHK